MVRVHKGAEMQQEDRETEVVSWRRDPFGEEGRYRRILASSLMGLPALQRLMTLQRDRQRRRRRRIQARCKSLRREEIYTDVGSIGSGSVNTRKGSPCQHDDNSQAGEKTGCSIRPDLPEDIWHHIHSLMPMRDAARAACLSHAFLRSWRCRPNLTLNRYVAPMKDQAHEANVCRIIDRIVRNHSGTGVKTLQLQLDGVAFCFVDRWLKHVVTPTIEVLTVILCDSFKRKCNFPCSVLSDGSGTSIRYLQLDSCAFRPTAKLGPLRNLTSLILHRVHVTEDELECFLSNSLALERLHLSICGEIICLKIPRVLQKFSCLLVLGCWRLQVIESKATNLSCLYIHGSVKLSLANALQIKRFSVELSPKALCYARSELPPIVPNLEILHISSSYEVADTPKLPTKFLYLKYLSIDISSGASFSPSYDYLSLVSFLEVSPSLETLILDVSQGHMLHKSVFGDPSGLRQITEHRHCYLKSVKMVGFSSAKSLVELTCYILKNAVSLDCLTLDILDGFRCSGNSGTCYTKSRSVLMEAHRALKAIRSYIQVKVPATVKFTVVEPCHRVEDGRRRRW